MTAEKLSLKCSQCSKEFKYDSERRRHEQSHAPQFKCEVCSKTFSFISALRRHEKQHERIGTVTCDLCAKKFRDETLLKRHVKYAHEGSYTCTKCDNIFHSEPALRTHMRSHKAESERRYHCSFEGCSKKFNFAHHLKHHELTHTNTKPYFCKICGKGFIQAHHLKTHLKTHSAVFSLHCSVPDCNKKFATEYAKKRHVAKCHGTVDRAISSDCNCSCDASTPGIWKETTLSDVNKPPYAEIKPKTENEDHVAMVINDDKFIINVPENLSLKSADRIENSVDVPITNDGNDVNSCELAVGGCIMDVKGENCVCAQISETVNVDFDFTPIETDVNKNITEFNSNIIQTDVNKNITEFNSNTSQTHVNKNITEISANAILIDINKNINELNPNTTDCKASKCCGGNCDEHYETPNDEKPEIEYRIDGTVKIKEFLDIDSLTIDLDRRTDRNVKSNAKFIPYNSCKAVLGKCIVSGSGMIGDECLCARMAMDDQVTAEEIEDITPRPKLLFNLDYYNVINSLNC